MADLAQEITEYRDSIDALLLNGEELEAVFPADVNVAPDSDEPKAIGITSHRLIVCHRRLRPGSSDRWRMRSILYSRIEEIELSRDEDLRREQIEARVSVRVHYRRLSSGTAARIDLQHSNPVRARELHDRILTHMLAVESHD
jgi:hypothetical protein